MNHKDVYGEKKNILQLKNIVSRWDDKYKNKLLLLSSRSTSNFSSKIIADSRNSNGERVTSFELRYPRIIHSEVLTHRKFSRNSSSSRAIPVKKLIDSIIDIPFIPFHWGKNQSGMQAYEEVEDWVKLYAIHNCYQNFLNQLDYVEKYQKLDIHKQIANRYLEPWMFITVVLTTSSFKHFELLRNNREAEPHFQYLAKLMKEARDISIPVELKNYDWHLPFISDEEKTYIDLKDLKKISTARCARVSYLTHDGVRDIEKDIELHNKLLISNHWSPFEHVVRPSTITEYYNKNVGNIEGFFQYRKEFSNEFIPD